MKKRKATLAKGSSDAEALSRNGSGTNARSRTQQEVGSCLQKRSTQLKRRLTKSKAGADQEAATGALPLYMRRDGKDESPRPFQYLKPRTRHVAQRTISKEWDPLHDSSRQDVQDIFRVTKRPVIFRQSDERRRIEAEAILNTLVRKLEKQLPKIPFPPKTKKTHFNLNDLLELNRSLENQLTPALHAVTLLRAEKSKEEEALARDQLTLDRLEADAKLELRMQKSQAEKMHPLLHLAEDTWSEPDDDSYTIRYVSKPSLSEMLSNDSGPDIAPALRQLDSHLKSMESNHIQLEELEKAILDAQAALEEKLHGRLIQDHIT